MSFTQYLVDNIVMVVNLFTESHVAIAVDAD